jgi:hypothetical protein
MLLNNYQIITEFHLFLYGTSMGWQTDFDVAVSMGHNPNAIVIDLRDQTLKSTDGKQWK